MSRKWRFFFSSLDIEQNSLFSGKVKSPNGTTGCTVFENHPKLSHLIFPCLFWIFAPKLENNCIGTCWIFPQIFLKKSQFWKWNYLSHFQTLWGTSGWWRFFKREFARLLLSLNIYDKHLYKKATINILSIKTSRWWMERNLEFFQAEFLAM